MADQPDTQFTVPFLLVRDMDPALDFYVNRLGFKLTNQWTPHAKIEWCWLQRGALTLMLHEDADKRKSGCLGCDGAAISAHFHCADALALHHEFAAKGIQVKEPFVSHNRWVVNFTDPDGYQISFESDTDAAEGTTYGDWAKQSA